LQWKEEKSLMLKTFSGFVLLTAAMTIMAQTATFENDAKTFRLDGGNVSYVFGVNPRGELQQLYWGGRLAATDRFPQAVPMREWASFDTSYTNTPQEYAGWGDGLYNEPALKITFAAGNRDLVLHYESHKSTPNGLAVVLKDIKAAIFVTLHYSIDPDTGILARSATIENKESQPVIIEQAAAAAWALPPSHYTLNYLTGRWAGEWTLTHEPIHPGARVIESRRGSTGHQANPWFAIQSGDPDENHGEVWFGALAWSGSWRITVEQDQLDSSASPAASTLSTSATSSNPASARDAGLLRWLLGSRLGEASRILHHYEIAMCCRTAWEKANAAQTRPVIYNSWEATEMNVTEAGQEALAEKAASPRRRPLRHGRRLVWPAQDRPRRPRRLVRQQGEISARPQAPHRQGPLPRHGLRPLGRARDGQPRLRPLPQTPRLGPQLPRPPAHRRRNQLVLNLARPTCAPTSSTSSTSSSRKRHRLSQVGLQPQLERARLGSAPAPTEQKKVYVEFTRNLYSILAELRAKHPKVEIESCSGGGGRVDLGILRYRRGLALRQHRPLRPPQHQDGFTYAYTPQVMMAWVTDSPHWLNKRTTSLEYRMLSSMQGSLGIGANIAKWSDEEQPPRSASSLPITRCSLPSYRAISTASSHRATAANSQPRRPSIATRASR
jgi:alpha-galactosidase